MSTRNGIIQDKFLQLEKVYKEINFQEDVYKVNCDCRLPGLKKIEIKEKQQLLQQELKRLEGKQSWSTCQKSQWSHINFTW